MLSLTRTAIALLSASLLATAAPQSGGTCTADPLGSPAIATAEPIKPLQLTNLNGTAGLTTHGFNNGWSFTNSSTGSGFGAWVDCSYVWLKVANNTGSVKFLKWSLAEETRTWLVAYGQDLAILPATDTAATPVFVACEVTYVVSTPVGTKVWILLLQTGSDEVPETTDTGDAVSTSSCVPTNILVQAPGAPPPPSS